MTCWSVTHVAGQQELRCRNCTLLRESKDSYSCVAGQQLVSWDNMNSVLRDSNMCFERGILCGFIESLTRRAIYIISKVKGDRSFLR